MKRCGWLMLVIVATLKVACASKTSLKDQPCPCTSGYACCRATNTCGPDDNPCAGAATDGSVHVADSTPRVAPATVNKSIGRVTAPSEGGSHQLLWTGTRFAILYQANAAGYQEDSFKKIILNLQFVDVTFGTSKFQILANHVISDLPTVAADAPTSQRMVWTGSGFRVFWSTGNRTIMMRKVDADGQVLSPAMPAVRNVSTTARLANILPVQGGWGVLWTDDRSGTRLPYFVRIDDGGSELIQQTAVVSGIDHIDTVGGVVGSEGTYTIVWDYGTTDSPNKVYTSTFDNTAKIISVPLEIYAGNHTALLSYFGTPVTTATDETYAAIWDADRGTVIAQLHNGILAGTLLMQGGPNDNQSPTIAAGSLMGGRTGLVMVTGSGKYRQDNPLPTSLQLLEISVPDGMKVVGQQTLNAASAADTCIEEYSIIGRPSQDTPGGDIVAYGVTWIDGCSSSGRALNFVVFNTF